jgi:hypothetical protein
MDENFSLYFTVSWIKDRGKESRIDEGARMERVKTISLKAWMWKMKGIRRRFDGGIFLYVQGKEC